MIYYRRYIEAFVRNTSELSMLEQGAYDRLLDHYMLHEKPIVPDKGKIFRAMRAITADEQAAIMAVLNEFFVLQDDGWHNERADEEIRVSKQARANGKFGGNPWVKELYNEPGFLYAIRGREDGQVKVGITVDPKRRLSEHRSKSGCRETLAVIPVEKMGVSESAVLARFTACAAGEWLALDAAQEQDLVEFMGTFNAPDSVPANVPKRVPTCEGDNAGGNVPADEAGNVHPFSLSTKTNQQPFQPSNLSAKSLAEAGAKTAPTAARKRRKAESGESKTGSGESKTGPAWDAYAAAHVIRYHVPPVRNRRTNALLGQLVDRLGAEEAPHVAVWYVQHNRGAYVGAGHALNLLVRDAEALRTEWATRTRKSDTEARQADRTMATGNAFAPLIEQAKALEAAK